MKESVFSTVVFAIEYHYLMSVPWEPLKKVFSREASLVDATTVELAGVKRFSKISFFFP